jgi:hypothetical protein
MIRPMPSPRGTNHERLYILRGRNPRMALDEAMQEADYPNARQHFEGGVDTLIEWCAENLARRDIEKLIDGLNSELHNRTVETITGDATPRRVNAPAMRRAEADFQRQYGLSPVRVMPTEPAPAASRPASPERMRKAEASLSSILNGLPANKVL